MPTKKEQPEKAILQTGTRTIIAAELLIALIQRSDFTPGPITNAEAVDNAIELTDKLLYSLKQ